MGSISWVNCKARSTGCFPENPLISRTTRYSETVNKLAILKIWNVCAGYSDIIILSFCLTEIHHCTGVVPRFQCCAQWYPGSQWDYPYHWQANHQIVPKQEYWWEGKDQNLSDLNLLTLLWLDFMSSVYFMNVFIFSMLSWTSGVFLLQKMISTVFSH